MAKWVRAKQLQIPTYFFFHRRNLHEGHLSNSILTFERKPEKTLWEMNVPGKLATMICSIS